MKYSQIKEIIKRLHNAGWIKDSNSVSYSKRWFVDGLMYKDSIGVSEISSSVLTILEIMDWHERNAVIEINDLRLERSAKKSCDKLIEIAGLEYTNRLLSSINSMFEDGASHELLTDYVDYLTKNWWHYE